MPSEAHNKILLVISGGWVLVADVPLSTEGPAFWVANAQVIRRWGTSKGLGELAAGPLKETVLDPLGDVCVGKAHVLFSQLMKWP